MVINRYSYTRRSSDSPEGNAYRTSARFLGADFLLVLLFLAVAFYFFFPRLFEKKEAYAPVSTVHAAYTAMQQIQDSLAAVLSETQDPESVQNALIEHIGSIVLPSTEEESAAQVFLLNVQGEVLYSKDRSRFEAIESIAMMREKKQGVLSHTIKGRSTLILYDTIASDILIVVAKPYPPLFRTGGETNDETK